MVLLNPGRPNIMRLRFFSAGRCSAGSGRSSGVDPAPVRIALAINAPATSPQNGDVSEGPR